MWCCKYGITHDLYFNLMSKTLPILCVSCKNPAYTVFFLERTLLCWLDWLKELKPSLTDAARFWYGMKVEASELISFAILVCTYTNGIMLVKMWAVLHQDVGRSWEGEGGWSPPTDVLAWKEGELTSAMDEPDKDWVLEKLFCVHVTLRTSLSSPLTEWLTHFLHRCER